MKKILIRAGMSPLEPFDAAKMIMDNTFGGNIGNLIYQYSVFRTLMTKDTIITPDYYTYGPDRADEINENYDCYIIPLADAFRNEFIPSLRRYTKLINKLKIPVVVIGVGLRAPFEPKLNEGFPFDKDVKNFVKAVLKKSSIIGVRGEITAKYLTRLGFREGIDHVVIGCPSMYTFGRELSIRNTRVTKESKICVNSSRRSQKKVLDFIARGMAEYPNHYFIPQWLKELKLTYLGAPSIAEISKKYPIKMSDPVYMNNRVRFFLNVPTWLEFMKDADLSFGARLHGNIAATIAGTPSLIIPKDARMRELAEYHQLTNLMANKITGKTSLLEIIEKSDFQSPVKVQGRNFDHFIDFLNKNQLEHIYINTVTPSTVPLDQKLADIQLQPPVKPVSGCSLEEMVERWERYYPLESSQKNGSKVLMTKENLVAMVMERIFKKKEQVFKRLSKVGSK
ncbi:polysaccharide pyruvyl transferase family protein [Niallia circulans]|uniref:polysaccharide pyruvyl transferase family protein n=1 Tax=Niallia TaxID=2837506 RepID=UPI00077CC722|nr:polysaccharide pyruvyl transferase family protein [Niallia circulans]MDR4316393.1 polysaccharide pyruvyl transferase family protein [Niallia circulans]MED3838437.1 polysaccharide pyruvyl transferase family protein [Niallia circulans]MED4243910.1 polysaccharide pyruvyl transferase family protein [Niallia circulans]MED4246304.1 polysaccharide pyruvyl transferase family protein [Niallia circulans]MED5098900.1 polysaccharide pyruvyl transferase family protein [Niallia circulans]